jgi:serine/threonine protein kinase
MNPEPFGRYLLVEPRGEGGMAQVYRAVLRDATGFEKQVALKRVRRDLCAEPDFVARFVDEARLVSGLSHSNIVQVFDFGQVDGEYYLAMELVDGPDLGRFLDGCKRCGQPVPIPAAIAIAARVARGLGAAHSRRDESGAPAPVVHRDISPQNVLLSRNGEVKVVDFGIALAAERAFRTRTGVIVGKCRYMAPEQAQGEPVDPRADIFALGALSFEMLAGRPLFDGASPQEVLQRVLSAPIPELRALNPEVPAELDAILRRMLSRDRAGRPADGNTLARELESLQHRIAPEYSLDDLSALIRVAVPPRPSRRWEAVATLPLGTTQAPLSSARAPDTEPSPPPEAPAPDHPEPAPSEPASAELSLALAPTAATPLPAAAAGDRSSTLHGPVSVAELPARRPLPLALAAVGLIALLLGGGARILFADRSAPPRVTARPGAAVERGAWRALVERVERGPTATIVQARITRAGGQVSGASVVLLSPRTGAPRFWTNAEGVLRMVFDTPPTGTLVLGLRGAGGATDLQIELAEAR